MMAVQVSKPGRPFGLSLAIVVVTLVFGIIPLLRIGLDIWLFQHFQNFDWNVETETETVEPIFSGIDFDFNYVSVIGQGMLAGAILILCVLAWRGRPRWIRYALLWAVLIIDAIYIFAIIVSFTTLPDISQGLTSADSVNSSLQVGYFVLLALSTTYLIWYLNREPARAFYRGSYRQDYTVQHDLPEVDQLSGTRQT
jgi:hypothetical protein